METKSRPECKFKIGDKVEFFSNYAKKSKFATVSRITWGEGRQQWLIWGRWHYMDEEPSRVEGYCYENIVKFSHPDYEAEGDWI